MPKRPGGHQQSLIPSTSQPSPAFLPRKDECGCRASTDLDAVANAVPLVYSSPSPGGVRPLQRFVRLGTAHQREPFGKLDRLNCKIDVEIGPIEV